MKYNTISTSSLASEGKKSSFTIYADMDISQNKITYSETEMTSIRGELEIVQKALKLQTKRCRQLVAEYTRRLQEKEVQYRSEKALRDDQLAKVLRALLIFEARLRQEQKFITHQLSEKDYIIKKQSNDIKKLLLNQYCKSCNQYYTSSPINESLDSSSEYVVTDCQDYQSSNFESLDSSSEIYANPSEKGYNKSESLYQSYNQEENSKSETESIKSIYQKNRNKDSLGRRSRKITHRKSIGTYFEVLKLRNDNNSPMSNEDNTSNDYDNLDSLPPESITDKISLISENIECIFEKNQQVYDGSESSPNVSLSECNNTVINKNIGVKDRDKNIGRNTPEVNEDSQQQSCKITESIPVFEADEETNDNWYASASDQEDEEHRDIYRNNPVLECMNQILLQNINDSLNSPPKTPNIERKSLKRVKFSDEEESKPDTIETPDNSNQNYYETPIQKTPNFYETPQSIYSNDYEQILSKCSETFSDTNQPLDGNFTKESSDQPANHYYVHMENKPGENVENRIVRKSKILRTPPALPPKPANLTTKYKNQNVVRKSPSEKSDDSITEFEPDYCSISELNLPQTKSTSFKKISVIAEINAPTSLDVLSKLHPQNDNDIPIKLSPVENQQCKTDHVDNRIDVSKLNSTNDIQVKTHSPIERGTSNENKSSPNETKRDTTEKIQLVENKLDILDKLISPPDNKQNVTEKILGKALAIDPKRDNLAKIHLNESKVDKLTKFSSNEARHSSNHSKANILGSMLSNDSKHDILGNRHFMNETQVSTSTKSPSNDVLDRRHFINDTKADILSKMYYTNECNINVLGKVNSSENKLKEKTQIKDNLVVKKCVEKLNIQLAKQTPIKSESSKKIESEIPKLPQVSEIIIPDESEDKEKEERISQDNYVKNNSQIFKLQTNRNELSRRPILIGSSVSSLISGFNQQLLSEIKKKPERNKLGKHLFSSFENLQNSDKQTPVKEEKSETPKFDNFDLSQNFEEFKLDDCELEEYTVEEDIQSEISDKSTEDNKSRTTSESTSSTRVELIRATHDFSTPSLNKNSIELLKKQLELQKNQLQNEQITKNNRSTRNNEPTYEHFLECTGLSSKSILTPSRLLSNHKSMLKPKDVKLRSKVRANSSMFERHSTSSVKYWSEPYI